MRAKGKPQNVRSWTPPTRTRQHLTFCLLLFAFLPATAGASDAAPPRVPCLSARSADCGVSASDMRKARELYERGARLKQAGKSEEALDYLERASNLVPRNVEFATAREITRQSAVYEHMARGNELLAAGQRIRAAAEFRSAAALDPANPYATQRMRDALADAAPQLSPGLQRVANSTIVTLAPALGIRDIHFRGDARGLFREVAASYGLEVEFDDSVSPRPVRFDIGKATFADAVAAAQRVTRTITTPLSSNRFLVAADTPENREKLTRAVMETFYITDATAPTDLNDLVNMLRAVFELNRISISTTRSSLTLRGPQPTVELAAQAIEDLEGGRPQVMLDVQVFEVSKTALRTVGIELPLQFQMFNLSSAAIAAALGGQGQDLINQLISSGAINQANSQAIQALLAQLQNQQGSIFSQPFATFGGGLTRFAVGIPAATARLSLNQSQLRSIEHATMRASQGNAASLLIGTRYPILNATFAPIFNSASLSQVLGNGSFIAPFPSFTYQDIGVSIKATPNIHRTDDVGMKLELQIQALGSQSFNGVPVISNRQYSGEITVKDGEPAVIAGMISSTDQETLRGIPGISHIPVAGRVASTNQVEHDAAELLVVVTPHIVRDRAGANRTLVLQR